MTQYISKNNTGIYFSIIIIIMSNNTSNNNNNNEEEEKQLLLAIGFCGVDDSVHPRLLQMICQSYPIVEFGILFRIDKTGEPRYPTFQWIDQLSMIATTNNNNTTSMKLAAHLCGNYVNDLLYGDVRNGNIKDFLNQLISWKVFHRIQINATAVNGVDTIRLHEGLLNLIYIIETYENQFEFIIQKNNETKPLWEGLINYYSTNKSSWPINLSMLIDESKGTGILLPSSWQNNNNSQQQDNLQQQQVNDSSHSHNNSIKIGYAGGIGPNNIRHIFPEIIKNSNNIPFWIDMESSLRTTIVRKSEQDNEHDVDIFDINKCFDVIQTIAELGYIKHPTF